MLTPRWTKDRRRLFVTFSFHEIGGWNHCVPRWEEEGGEGKKWMELDGDSLKWGETREEVLSGCRTVHDFARNYQPVRTRKIITPVEQIKFLTNALNTLTLYCSFNPVPCFSSESLWISNEFIWFGGGRETLRIFINITKKFALRIGSILELEHLFTTKFHKFINIFDYIELLAKGRSHSQSCELLWRPWKNINIAVSRFS